MSSILSEADLNDFISPGLACIKPVQNEQKRPENSEDALVVGKEPSEPQKVSISLQDCLACAGCITSSEEILLGRQNHKVFLEAKSNFTAGMSLAVSISPQCRLSLANFYDLSLDVFDAAFLNLMLCYFEARYVVGTQMGRTLSISETNYELSRRKTLDKYKKPQLCAVCPGFVLYSEKTKPELVPHLLDVKSPQQITGALLKANNQNIYHLAVMPCFDKKLEASRADTEGEVDCVITPREMISMLQELNLAFSDFLNGPSLQDLQQRLTPEGWNPRLHWVSNSGSSSGGFAFQYVLNEQRSNPGSEIIQIMGKNADIREYRLVDSTSGQVLASSSEVYGFRNIQNLVRKLGGARRTSRNIVITRKRASEKNASDSKPTEPEPARTDFIEVMACPGGCINGGGLLNEEANTTRRRALAKKLDTQYSTLLPQTECSEEFVSSNRYKFSAIQKSTDVVTVGNTW
ncbi:LAMI_0E00254g1_1 [Lachancea mirantina]|uniref:Cytosolic Fe-S cluster assembly factor NAR1 n=1 Tax=Lachancea mirantina TaxID=1230905 RepID=A0A1G4JHZ2_9SACH|nr:LAMI_0E00254g1_1 [Lachancea mirantina]